MPKYQSNYRENSNKTSRKKTDFIIPGIPNGVNVPGPTTGDLEKALKIFKRQVKESEILTEFKDRMEYTKPAVARRKKKKDAVRAEFMRLKKFRETENDTECWTTIVDGQAM